MHIIKLDAIESTNSFLRQLCSEKLIEDYTVVIANHQTKGRGQMGTRWQSEQDKNLTCSVFKRIGNLNITSQFFISIVVSLSVYDAMNTLNLKRLKIKWPNDILSEQRKICGILIENVIKQQDIQSTIIGIGLNVNQTKFDDLPNASSIKSLTGNTLAVEDVLKDIVQRLQYYFQLLEKEKYDELHQSYLSKLYRKDMVSAFKDENNYMFSGCIRSVSREGLLELILENDHIRKYDMKQLRLLS